MLNKWSYVLFVVFLIVSLLMVPGVYAQRQHDSSEEEENGRLSDELEEVLNNLDEDDYILSQETTSSVSYDRQGAYDYADYYWNRVCSDGYFWDGPNWDDLIQLTPGSLLGWRETSGVDCAHFVSCAIGSEPNKSGGGLDINRYRTRDLPSYGEAGAMGLRDLLLGSSGFAERVNCYTELAMGDVIILSFKDSTYGHSFLYLGDGKVSSHSKSRFGRSWVEYQEKYSNSIDEIWYLHIKAYDEPDCTVTLQSPPDNATISFPYTFEWSVEGNCTNFELVFLNVDEGSGGYINVSGTSHYISASDWDNYVSVIGSSSEYVWAIRKDGTVISNIHYFSVDDNQGCSVNTPNRPSGPTSGEPGVNYTYSTGGSSCAAGHSVQYRFWWRKVGGSWTSTGWSSSASTTLNFPEEGTYEIDAEACCANSGVTSGYSDVLTVAIGADMNCSVNTPDRPSGPTSGEPGVNYTYSTGGSSCAAGHSVQYRFWWRKVGGSWTSTGWSSSASTTLNFPEEGTYEIDAEACCANSGVTSGYSDVLTVVIGDDLDCSVNTPDRPSGPTSGETGILYEFETGGSSCVAGHDVQYQFSMRQDGGTWYDGDWKNSGWMVGEFFEEGTYDIRARARCANNISVTSDWSETLKVFINVSIFSDVTPDMQFYPYIEAIYAEGITTGYDDGTYRPNEPVTRGQMAAFLSRVLELRDVGDPNNPSFTDVSPSMQFFGYIEAIYAEGITTGYSDGTYKPNEPVTRGQMAAFLSRALELRDVGDPNNPSFTDVSPSMQFFGYIEAIYAEEITTGYGDGTYRPNEPVTRGQMAAFLSRALGLH